MYLGKVPRHWRCSVLSSGWSNKNFPGRKEYFLEKFIFNEDDQWPKLQFSSASKIYFCWLIQIIFIYSSIVRFTSTLSHNPTFFFAHKAEVSVSCSEQINDSDIVGLCSEALTRFIHKLVDSSCQIPIWEFSAPMKGLQSCILLSIYLFPVMIHFCLWTMTPYNESIHC